MITACIVMLIAIILTAMYESYIIGYSAGVESVCAPPVLTHRKRSYIYGTLPHKYTENKCDES